MRVLLAHTAQHGGLLPSHENVFILAEIVSADAEVTSPLLPGGTCVARSQPRD